MGGKLFKALCGLVLPGSVLFGGCLLAGRVPQVVLAEPRAIRLVCLGAMAAGLLLSAVFRRSRLFFAMVIVALGYFTVEWLAPRIASPDITQVLVNATAAVMAVNLAVLSLLRDRGVISPPGARRLVVLAAQVLAVIVISLPSQARAAHLLERPFLEPRLTHWSRISQPVIAVFLAAGLLLLVKLAWRRRPVDSGLFWALTTVFFGFNTRAQAFGVYTAAATLILIVAVVETSYAMAYRDELTDLPGRRALNESLLQLGSSYAVGMVDVDHFKNFNDIYGHDAGDHVLRKVAAKLNSVGGNGKPFRYGGEEFAVIFPGKTVEEAFVHLEKVRKDIEEAKFTVRGMDRRKRASNKKSAKPADVTVSVGLAGNHRNKMSADEVVQAADKALYRAKAFGRNCTVAADGGSR